MVNFSRSPLNLWSNVIAPLGAILAAALLTGLLLDQASIDYRGQWPGMLFSISRNLTDLGKSGWILVTSAALVAVGLAMVRLEHFQEKCEAVFRPEMRKNKELEHLRQKCEAVLPIGNAENKESILRQKCEAVLGPEMRKNKELEHFGDSEINGNALAKERQAIGHRLALASGFVFTSVAISGITVNLAKRLIGRARPELFNSEGLFGLSPFSGALFESFPSGHATTDGALVAALAILFPKARIPLLVGGAFLAITRVIVSKHYPSDIVAGFFYGIWCSLMMARVFRARFSLKI